MAVIDIFDRIARRRRRDRAATAFAAHDFVRAFMIDGLLDRLSLVKRSFADTLDLGTFDGTFPAPPGARIVRCDAGWSFAKAAGGVQADEDRLPFADASFDLVVSAGVLDQVNDLPGALSLIRRVLRPDGVFLGAFVGAGSLTSLRAALRDAEPEPIAARIHPQIDVRAAGDLLMRAGFALPVADVEVLTAEYRDVDRLLADLRGSAQGNLLHGRAPLTRLTLQALREAFVRRQGVAGRTAETFSIVFLTGWAPDPSQPQPARRGSATASLLQVLPQQSPS